jgi:4-hydroxy 2-oxovalerate aldolase
MKKIQLLDCTLRDGGYVNDWLFGEAAIKNIERLVVDSGVDIFEIGFLKDEPYQKDRAIYSSADRISNMLQFPKKDSVLYAAMVEATTAPFPLEKLEKYSGKSIDIIRAMVWKRLLNEGFEYCKALVEKGYKVCVQPVRVDQYSEDEFTAMVKLFNNISPMAVYGVDSWGTQNKKSILRYLTLADKYLKPGIALGYHGHNNLMQAFSVAEAFVEQNFERPIMIDGSVYGIGRGAGNLNIEVFARYLNEYYGTKYKIEPLLAVYETYLKPIYKTSPWGYSLPLFLTAKYNCNIEYGIYYGYNLGLDTPTINIILQNISEHDKIQFIKEIADRHLEDYKRKQEDK